MNPEKLPERFRSKFIVSTEKVYNDTPCWEWSAALNTYGYGQYWLNGKMALAHRVAYEMLVGPLQVGLQCDHLCRNRRCCQPLHIQPVSCKENLARGKNMRWASGSYQKEKTHCPQGHPYDEINTYAYRGQRGCKQCRRENLRRWREKNR